jgi:hypothetical protein
MNYINAIQRYHEYPIFIHQLMVSLKKVALAQALFKEEEVAWLNSIKGV